MEYWEFLLQKEGDRSWLPLESPNVEILEGRYRVVARSSRANAKVEIRVSHLTTEELPPKRRLQKRSSRTNQDGLMVVMPFTRLKPGIWELRCAGDLMSDLLGNGWQYGVRIQVLANDLESTEDWDLDWPEQSDESTEKPTQAEATIATTSAATTTGADVSAAAAAPIDSADSFELASPAESEIAEPLQPEPEEVVAPVGTAAPDQTEALPPTSGPEVTLEPLPAVTASEGHNLDRLREIAEQMSQQVVDEAFQAFDAISDSEVETAQPEDTLNIQDPERVPEATRVPSPAPEPEPSATSALENLVAPAAPTSFQSTKLQLTLTQETHTAGWGQSVTLVGQVEVADGVEGATSEKIGAQTSTTVIQPTILQVCLRDPQSSALLAEVRQALPTQSLPFPFACPIEIPPDCRTHLILGEINLCDPTAQSDSPVVLATQSFTITGDLNELLGAIADDLSEDDLLDLPLESSSQVPKAPSKPAAPLNLAFLDLAKTSKEIQPFHFHPSGNKVLPPQIYKAEPEMPASKSPELPVIPLVSPTVLPAEMHENDADNESSLLDPDDSAAPATSHPELDSDDLPDSGAWQLDESENEESEVGPDQAQAALPSAESRVAHAFESLKLQERFWTRLNSLAADAELSEWLQINLSAADSANAEAEAELAEAEAELAEAEIIHQEPAEPVDIDQAVQPAASMAPEVSTAPAEPPPTLVEESAPALTKPSLEPDLVAHEIVVDDDQPLGPERSPVQPAPELPTPLILPADEPVPTPELGAPVGELTAGKPITVQVKLPNILPRIYVKLWVQDRQTRSLLDGPRWLVDFAPNGRGDLEAFTQLTVPLGCMEIQFEAIAVEMQTQRESHKVTINRAVIPSDLPSLSLDEFNP